MTSRLRQFGRSVFRWTLPASLRQRVRRLWGWRWFRGDYATWAEARRASGGYDSDEILRRILDATLAVQAGQAVFERDGVLFHQPEPDQTLLRALEKVRSLSGGKLRVLDFGGSLGSTYWRHRANLSVAGEVSWHVVEQPNFVQAGQTHLAGKGVRFFDTVHAAERESAHDVLLCSCVFQYLEDPWAALEEWGSLPIRFVILNNLPLHDSGPDRLRVQHVPPSIYPATYPVRFFNRAQFLARLARRYDVLDEFRSEAVWPVDSAMYPSTGLLLQRRPGP